MKLTITALVEVEFDFDPSFINIGEISKADTVVKHAYLTIKDPEKMKIAEVTTSSPFVSAQQVDDRGTEDNPGRIEFLVKVVPGLTRGRINEIVTVRSDDASHAAATLKIIGHRIGDVTVTPEMLHFRLNGSPEVSDLSAQNVEIVNRSGTGKLHVLGVEDPDDRLQFDLQNAEDGLRYTLAVKPKPQVLTKKGGVTGSIIITTDSPEDKEITMRYIIVVQ